MAADRFAVGRNWQRYLAQVGDAAIEAARTALSDWCESDLSGKSSLEPQGCNEFFPRTR